VVFKAVVVKTGGLCVCDSRNKWETLDFIIFIYYIYHTFWPFTVHVTSPDL